MGPAGPRVDGLAGPRVDSRFAAEGGGIAFGDEYIIPLRGMKTIQPPWRAWEMHPYPRFAVLPPKGETTHNDLRVAVAPTNHVRCAPRRGKFALCFTLEMIKSLKV